MTPEKIYIRTMPSGEAFIIDQKENIGVEVKYIRKDIVEQMIKEERERWVEDSKKADAYLVERMKRVIELIDAGEGHMAVTKLLADISALSTEGK